MSLFAVAAALGAANLLGEPARESARAPQPAGEQPRATSSPRRGADLALPPVARGPAREPSRTPGPNQGPVSTAAAEALLVACAQEQPPSAERLAALVEALPRRLLELRSELPEERRQLETLALALARGARRRGPQTLLGELLGAIEDNELHHRILRELPLGAGSARAAAAAALRQAKPLLRISLLNMAAQLLERERDEDVEAVFSRLAREDPRERVRAAAVQALGRPLGPANFTLLEDVIVRDPSDLVRRGALASIARPGTDQALLTLNGVATDVREPLAIRLSAIRALGKLGTERAAASLEEIANTAAGQQEIQVARTLAGALRARLASEPR